MKNRLPKFIILFKKTFARVCPKPIPTYSYIFNNDDDAAIGEVESYNYYAVVIEHTK